MGTHEASSDPDDGTDNEPVLEKSPKPPSKTKIANLTKLKKTMVAKQQKREDFSKEAKEYTKIMKTIDPDYDEEVLNEELKAIEEADC